MLLTGKKSCLASLVLIFTTKLANACVYAPELKDQIIRQLAERDFTVKAYFFPVVLLIVANIAMFFVRRKHDYLLGFAIVLTALISAPLTIFSIVNDACGNSIVANLQINFHIFLGFLVLQICLWLKGAGLRFKKEKPAAEFS
jgi:uncharacterized protein (DUF486 family)